MHLDLVALVAMAIALAGLFIFVRRQSKTGGRWGLGAWAGTNCPRCGSKLPMIRKPTSKEETLWGGWTCPKCGCKVDKYGKERVAG